MRRRRLAHLVPLFKKERITYDTLCTLVGDEAATARLGVRMGEVLRLRKALANESDDQLSGALAAESEELPREKTPRKMIVRRNSFEAWLDTYQARPSACMPPLAAPPPASTFSFLSCLRRLPCPPAPDLFCVKPTAAIYHRPRLS